MARDQDDEWFVSAVDAWGDRLAQFVKAYTHDPHYAQDIAQEAFLRLYQERRRFPHKALTPGWLFTVARNLIRDDERKPIPVLQSDPAKHVPSAHPPVTTRVAIQMTLDQMDPLDQHCLWLFYYGDWSIKQIAEALKVSPGTVKTRLYRARQKFAELWREDHG